MAKPGSTLWAWRNASLASSYSNVWSAATPRIKKGCAAAEPDVGNETAPLAAGCAATRLERARKRKTTAAQPPGRTQRVVKTGQQSVVHLHRPTESGEAPGWQGATTEYRNI